MSSTKYKNKGQPGGHNKRYRKHQRSEFLNRYDLAYAGHEPVSTAMNQLNTLVPKLTQ